MTANQATTQQLETNQMGFRPQQLHKASITSSRDSFTVSCIGQSQVLLHIFHPTPSAVVSPAVQIELCSHAYKRLNGMTFAQSEAIIALYYKNLSNSNGTSMRLTINTNQ